LLSHMSELAEALDNPTQLGSTPDPSAAPAAAKANADDYRKRLGAVAGGCLSALLIAAIIAMIGTSFRYGIDRGSHAKLTLTGSGQFVSAVCAILAQHKYHTGRYVCAGSAYREMQDAGLWYDDATVTRIGKTLPQWLADTAFLNGAIDKVFAEPRLASDGGVRAFGWGGDAGYMDFVEFAFSLFGHRIVALYYGYFLLLLISTALFCIQFWRNYLALFAVLAFQFSTAAIWARRILPAKNSLNVADAR